MPSLEINAASIDFKMLVYRASFGVFLTNSQPVSYTRSCPVQEFVFRHFNVCAGVKSSDTEESSNVADVHMNGLFRIMGYGILS